MNRQQHESTAGAPEYLREQFTGLSKKAEEARAAEKNIDTRNYLLGVAQAIPDQLQETEQASDGADNDDGSRSEWIKCSERVPERDGYYLVALSDPDDVGWSTDRAWTAFWSNRCRWWDSSDPVEDGQPVTHWMPLPIPPQQQEGE